MGGRVQIHADRHAVAVVADGGDGLRAVMSGRAAACVACEHVFAGGRAFGIAGEGEPLPVAFRKCLDVSQMQDPVFFQARGAEFGGVEIGAIGRGRGRFDVDSQGLAVFNRHKRRVLLEVADDPSVGGPLVDDGNAVETSAVGIKRRLVEFQIAENGFSGMFAEQQPAIDGFDWLARHENDFLFLPVVRSGRER